MAMAHYFNEYIRTGDEKLLAELVYDYRYKVPQEASVETFEKWRNLRDMFGHRELQVVGVDIPASYKFSARLVYEMMNPEDANAKQLKSLLDNPQTDYAISPETPLKNYFDKLAASYGQYKESFGDVPLLEDILKGIETTYKVIRREAQRDSVMAENYKRLKDRYGYAGHKQFIRMGVYHMMKDGFDNMHPGFIATLVYDKVFDKDDVTVIMGMLFNSAVMGIRQYGEDGEFIGCTPQSGNEWTGGDLVYLLGLDKDVTTDFTYVELSAEQLKDVNMEYFPWKPKQGLDLSGYVDAVVVISNSAAATPVEGMI